MATRREQWLEDFDDLITRMSDLYLPEPLKDKFQLRLEELQEEINEQMELRSVDWDS